VVKTIRIYFEGDISLRPGFRKFFNSIYDSARQQRIEVVLVAGGATVVEDFMDAMNNYPNSFNVLLKDAEGPDNGNLVTHIRSDPHWRRNVGALVTDDQLHFMVQVMEAWFLADRQALHAYYGRGFLENRLPDNPNVEQISKTDVTSGLDAATRRTTKGRYHKTRHAPELLGRLDVSRVRSAAPACERVFTALEALVS
jgi:hypothetical protein